MKKIILYISLVVITLFVTNINAIGQEERKFIRKGNKEYNKGNFKEATVNYLKSSDIDSTYYTALFNVGNAGYKDGNLESALTAFQKLSEDVKSSENPSDLLYNLGNTHFKMEKYEEAIDSYKKSLRINPSDTTAKYNLAYAQLMLKKQQDENKDKDDKKDDKDDKEDKEDKKDQDKKDDKDDKKDQDKKDDKKDKNNKDDKDDKKEQKPGEEPKISKEQAEKMLEAIQANEDKTQEKVKESKEKTVVGTSRKNW